jgi:hypothetical protein
MMCMMHYTGQPTRGNSGNRFAIVPVSVESRRQLRALAPQFFMGIKTRELRGGEGFFMQRQIVFCVL